MTQTCPDEWQPPHPPGARPDACGTCAGMRTPPPLCGPIVPGTVNKAARRIRACGPGNATPEDLQIVRIFQDWLAGDRTVWDDRGNPVSDTSSAKG